MAWLNIYPLMICPNSDMISTWINIDSVKKITFQKSKELFKITVSTDEVDYSQHFENSEDANKCWNYLHGALGIKMKHRRGPKRKFYETLEN